MGSEPQADFSCERRLAVLVYAIRSGTMWTSWTGRFGVGGLARCGAIGGPVLASGLGFRSVREFTTLLVSLPAPFVTLLILKTTTTTKMFPC